MGTSNRNPQHDGRIQRLDQRFKQIGSRLGNWWCDTTGLSRESLTRVLGVVSIFAIVQHFFLYQDAVVLVFLLVSVISLSGIQSTLSETSEQIQSEVAGLPRNAIAFFRLQIMFLGLYFLVSGLALLVGAELSLPTDTSNFGASLLLGLALVSAQTSDYIRRSIPPAGKRGQRQPGKLHRYQARVHSSEQ